MRSLWINWRYLLAPILAITWFVLYSGTYPYPDSSYLHARYGDNLRDELSIGFNTDDNILLSASPLLIVTNALLPHAEQPNPLPVLLLIGLGGIAWVNLVKSPLVSFLGLAAWILLPTQLFGGGGFWLTALGLLLLDIRSNRTIMIFIMALLLLVTPWAVILVLLLGIYHQFTWREWGYSFGLFVWWWVFALITLDVEGLTLQQLDIATWQWGIAGIFIVACGVLWRQLWSPAGILVLFSIAYGLIDSTAFIGAGLMLLYLTWQQEHAAVLNRRVGISALVSIGCGLLIFNSSGLAISPASIPSLEGSIGYVGSYRDAYQYEQPVYHLKGLQNPHLRDLYWGNDNTGIIVATAPEWILLDTLPDDLAIRQLQYVQHQDYWQRQIPVGAWQDPQALNIAFSPDLHLIQLTQDRQAAAGGDVVRIGLDWERVTNKLPQEALTIILNLVAPFTNAGSTQHTFPIEKWEHSTPTTYLVLPINQDAPFGVYQLELSMYVGGGLLPIQTIGSVVIPPEQDTDNQPSIATFSDGQQQADLLSAELSLDNNNLQVDLLWRGNGTIQQDYIVFVHLTPLNDETPLLQADAPPAGGRYPTSVWQQNELIPDSYLFSEVPSGDYVVRIGFFNPDVGRLPVGEGTAYITVPITIP